MRRKAEKIVSSHFNLIERPHQFETQKRGIAWIVKFVVISVGNIQKHEWHINANTGNVINKKQIN